jgi:hypothetical protein
MTEKKFRIIIEGSYKSTKKEIAEKAISKLMLTAQENFHVNKGGAFTTLAKVSVENPEEVIKLSWSIVDVMERAEDRGTKITKARARKILAEMNRKHDASIGISWDVIDCYLDDESIR